MLSSDFPEGGELKEIFKVGRLYLKRKFRFLEKSVVLSMWGLLMNRWLTLIVGHIIVFAQVFLLFNYFMCSFLKDGKFPE